MKRFLSIMLGVMLLLSLTAPAYAKNKFGPPGQGQVGEARKMTKPEKKELKKVVKQQLKLKNLVASIAGVDVAGNFITIREKGDVKVDLSKAVIVKITSEGSKSVGVADLVVGEKVQMLVKKEKNADKSYTGVLVYQIIQPTSVTPPTPPVPPTLPELKFSAGTGTGAENVLTVDIPVTLSIAATQEVKVDYVVTGTASGEGVDFTLANGTLTIPAGQTTGNIALTVVDDTTVEQPDETVIVTLSNPINATLGTSAVYTYTITNND